MRPLSLRTTSIATAAALALLSTADAQVFTIDLEANTSATQLRRAAVADVNGDLYRDIAYVTNEGTVKIALNPGVHEASLTLLASGGSTPFQANDVLASDAVGEALEQRLLVVGPTGLGRFTFDSLNLPITYTYEALLGADWNGAALLRGGRNTVLDMSYVVGAKPGTGGSTLLLAQRLADGSYLNRAGFPLLLPNLNVLDVAVVDVLGTGNPLLFVLTDLMLVVLTHDGAFVTAVASPSTTGELALIKDHNQARQRVAWFRSAPSNAQTLAFLAVPSGSSALTTDVLALPGDSFARINAGDFVGDSGHDLALSKLSGDELLVLANQYASSGSPGFSVGAGANRTVTIAGVASTTNSNLPVVLDHDRDGDGDLVYPTATGMGLYIHVNEDVVAESLAPLFVPMIATETEPTNIWTSGVAATGIKLNLKVTRYSTTPTTWEHIEVQLWRTTRTGEGHAWKTDPKLYDRVLVPARPTVAGAASDTVEIVLDLDKTTSPDNVYYYYVLRYIADNAAGLVTAASPAVTYTFAKNGSLALDYVGTLPWIEHPGTLVVYREPPVEPGGETGVERPDESGTTNGTGCIPDVGGDAEGPGNTGGGSQPPGGP